MNDRICYSMFAHPPPQPFSELYTQQYFLLSDIHFECVVFVYSFPVIRGIPLCFDLCVHVLGQAQLNQEFTMSSLLFYRSGDNIVHVSIMSTQRSSHGYTLNGVTAPILYKLIHYFMENPIYADTFLHHSSHDKDVSKQNVL